MAAEAKDIDNLFGAESELTGSGQGAAKAAIPQSTPIQSFRIFPMSPQTILSTEGRCRLLQFPCFSPPNEFVDNYADSRKQRAGHRPNRAEWRLHVTLVWQRHDQFVPVYVRLNK